jgi:hypothetical protein
MASLLGCSTGPRRYKVSGTATFDGQPMPEGDILFFPLDKATGPEAGKIKDGHFQLKAREGKHRVEISASRILPGSKVRGAGGEPVAEEYIPEQYNNKSTLEAEVKPQAENTFEFQLERKKK